MTALKIADYDRPDEQPPAPKRTASGNIRVPGKGAAGDVSIDWTEWVHISTAAERLDMSEGNLRRKCPDLADRDLAMQARPPKGGQRCWWIKITYSTRLHDGPLGLTSRVPAEFLNFPQKARDHAMMRRACVMQYRTRLLDRKSGAVKTWIGRLVKQLSAQHPDIRISARSLMRWHADLRNDCDIVKLVNRSGGNRKAEPTPAAWQLFKALWLHENQLTKRVAWKTVDDKARAEGWTWISYPQLKRRVQDDIPEHVQVFHRDHSRYLSEYEPRIEMDPDAWAAGVCWLGDHCVLDQWVRWKDGVERPWVTAWMDWKTTKIVGWHMGITPSSETIRTSFFRAVQDPANAGGPDILHLDNGIDYKCEQFTGSTFTKKPKVFVKKGYADRPEFKGLFEHFGFEMIFAIPGNPTGKSKLERWFGTMHEGFDKLNLHSYAGNCPANRPPGLDHRLKKEREKVPHFDEIKAAFGRYVEDYNAKSGHSRKGLDGVSANRAYLAARRRVFADPKALEHFTLPMSPPVRVRKFTVAIKPTGGVTMRYTSNDDRFRKLTNTDQYVRVAYDPDDLMGQVFIYDAETLSLICSAEHERAGSSARIPIGREAVSSGMKRRRKVNRANRDLVADAGAQYKPLADLALEEAAKQRIADDKPTEPERAAASAAPMKPARSTFDGQSNRLQQLKQKRAAGAEQQVAVDYAELVASAAARQQASGLSVTPAPTISIPPTPNPGVQPRPAIAAQRSPAAPLTLDLAALIRQREVK